MDEGQSRALLQRIRILETLPPAALDRLAKQVTWRTMPRGAPIASHGDGGDSVFFLAEGLCEATMTAKNGRTLSLSRIEPGAHFGELALLTGAPRSVRVASKTECMVGACPRPAFEALFEHAAFARALAAGLARLVVALTDRLYEQSLLEVRYRIYGELMRMSKSAAPTPEGLLLDPCPGHAEIGAKIGCQREPVGRELSWLEEQGVLATSRKGKTLLFRDIDKLRALMEQRAGATASHHADWQD